MGINQPSQEAIKNQLGPELTVDEARAVLTGFFDVADSDIRFRIAADIERYLELREDSTFSAAFQYPQLHSVCYAVQYARRKYLEGVAGPDDPQFGLYPKGLSLYMGADAGYSIADSIIDSHATIQTATRQSTTAMPRSAEEEAHFVEEHGYYPDPMGR